jgi:hypothetical protein
MFFIGMAIGVVIGAVLGVVALVGYLFWPGR